VRPPGFDPVFVSNPRSAAVAAAHSVGPDRWSRAYGAVTDLLAPRFARHEPLRNAGSFMLGLLSSLERKNCWTISEDRGRETPYAFQHLLSRASWDADAVRDDLRGYVVDAFGECDGIYVLDETGDLKAGTESVGVQRQYTGTAGRIENSQVTVCMTYVGRRGHAFIDRALYLPKSWTGDRERCRKAGVPDDVEFATKPTLAGDMLTRAVAAGVPAGWVAGDEVYGGNPALRAKIRGLKLGYVLMIACNQHVRPRPGRCPPNSARSSHRRRTGNESRPDEAARASGTTTGCGATWCPRTTRTAGTTGCWSAATAAPANWPTCAATTPAASRCGR
jgi:SRSO17 transposase